MTEEKRKSREHSILFEEANERFSWIGMKVWDFK